MWITWKDRVVSEASGLTFAVMEDDSVLCAECVHEAQREARGAQSLVHAWIDPGAGVCCAWCGEPALGGRWSA